MPIRTEQIMPNLGLRNVASVACMRSLRVAASFVVLVTLAGCPGASQEEPPPLNLGQSVPVSSATVDAEGGTINLADATGVLEGITIEVPAGALEESTTFNLSYRPIESHTLGSEFNPVTPVITIDNGDVTATEPILVTVPVEIAEDEHVMAFIYDEETGRFEALAEIDHDATSFTFATTHFCDILLNKVFWQLLLDDFPSGFQLQHDNWQYDNPGTFLSSGGICSGMSATALYYYLEKKTKDNQPELFGRYDNDGDTQNPTPDFGEDDSNAIYIAATAQWYRENYQSSKLEYWYNIAREKDDMWTFLMFAHAIMMTDEPQYVAIFNEDYKTGHALIVYKKMGDTLYVADPNEPNIENKITYKYDADGVLHFEPYKFRTRSGISATDYTEVIFVGHRDVVAWEDLKELWEKMDDGTVGDEFPQYHFVVLEEDAAGNTTEVPFLDGYSTEESEITLKIVTDGHKWFTPRLTWYDQDQTERGQVEGETIEVTLSDGDNRVGILAEADPADLDDPDEDDDWAWTGFDWFNVERKTDNATTIGTTIISPVNGSTYTTDDTIMFSGTGADADGNPLTGSSLVWTSNRDGELGTGESFTKSLSENTHQITLTATDANGQETIDHITIIVGAGAEPTITVWYDGELVDDANMLIRDEPVVEVGTTENLEFTIKNTGAAPLQIIVPLEIREEDQGEFAIVREPEATVDPGESTTFVLAFTPQDLGYGQTSIYVESNGFHGYDYGVHINIMADYPWTYYAFIDEVSGLMWQKKSWLDTTGWAVPRDWQDATDYCANLELAGYDDWRMPSKDEVVDILGGYDEDNQSYAHACADSPSCLEFESSAGVYGYEHWTSTPHDDAGDYWSVKFSNGYLNHRAGEYTGVDTHCVRESGE